MIKAMKMYKRISGVALAVMCIALLAFGFLPMVTKVSGKETATEYGNAKSPNKNVSGISENLYRCHWGNFYISDEEFHLVCRTVYCEAGNQEYETQIMVALTILNRYASGGMFGNDIYSVIFKKNAYAVTKWKTFDSTSWDSKVEQAVMFALQTNHHPKNMYYFRTLKYHDFGKEYMKSGDLYFSTQN